MDVSTPCEFREKNDNNCHFDPVGQQIEKQLFQVTPKRQLFHINNAVYDKFFSIYNPKFKAEATDKKLTRMMC